MIRKAIIEEAKYIADLTERVKKIMHEVDGIPQWDNGYPNYEVFVNDITNETLFVYLVEDKIAGYIVVNTQEEAAASNVDYRQYDKYVVIHRFAVDPNYRGQGIAQKLVDYVLEMAKEYDLEAVRIDTNSKNKQMNNLILKMGFEYRGQMALRENCPLWNAYDIIIG